MCVGVDTLEIAHPKSEVSSRVTVSIGVATSTPAVDSTWEELTLLAEASAALKTATREGRNRVAVATNAPAEGQPLEQP